VFLLLEEKESTPPTPIKKKGTKKGGQRGGKGGKWAQQEEGQGALGFSQSRLFCVPLGGGGEETRARKDFRKHGFPDLEVSD
jgi:hypothetical protein